MIDQARYPPPAQGRRSHLVEIDVNRAPSRRVNAPRRRPQSILRRTNLPPARHEHRRPVVSRAGRHGHARPSPANPHRHRPVLLASHPTVGPEPTFALGGIQRKHQKKKGFAALFGIQAYGATAAATIISTPSLITMTMRKPSWKSRRRFRFFVDHRSYSIDRGFSVTTGPGFTTISARKWHDSKVPCTSTKANSGASQNRAETPRRRKAREFCRFSTHKRSSRPPY